MSETTHLALPYLAAAQAQKHVTHNEALGRLDVVVQLSVLNAALSEPPGSPEEGDRYIVGPDAAGEWAGHDGDVVAFVDGAWLFLVPRPGWVAFDAASGSVLVRQGADWESMGSHLGPIARLGVNAIADDTTRLAVRSAAALFAAIDEDDGGSGDIRLLASKAGDGDTASLLFQTNFSGRAEIGLAGDDDLVLKVSPDGESWTEGMRVDGATGVPTIRYDNTTSGLLATSLEGAIDELAGSALIGPGSASDGAPAVFDGTSGRVLKESTFADFKTALALAKADVGLGNVLNVPQRERITANRTYYVRTDGSDSNDGLADTAGGAFLTIQKAIDTVAALDRSIFNVTIQVGAGTYAAGGVVTAWGPGSGTVSIVGDATTPSNVTISVAGNAFTFSGGTTLLRGFKLVASSYGLFANNYATVNINGAMDYGACTFAHMHLETYATVSVSPSAHYTISGGAGSHWELLSAHATLICRILTVTLTGTPAFTQFLRSLFFGQATVDNITFSGSATGVRYQASYNGLIFTGGAGASYLPGSSAGSTSAGGQYV